MVRTMSEWERDDGQRGGEGTIRGYENGVLIGSTGRPRGVSDFGWELHDERAVEALPPFGRALTEADAQAACDAAAVAWVLIALAKRAAAWAESIDARLAREYRATQAALDTHRLAGSCGDERAYRLRRDALEDALGLAEHKLLRGSL